MRENKQDLKKTDQKLEQENKQELLKKDFKIFYQRAIGGDLQSEVKAFIKEKNLHEYEMTIASGARLAILLSWDA